GRCPSRARSSRSWQYSLTYFSRKTLIIDLANHNLYFTPCLDCRNLKIDYPVSSKPGKYDFSVAKEDFLPFGFAEIWGAMEKCQKLGLARAIGVSNFSSKKLLDILSIAKIPPVVNQLLRSNIEFREGGSESVLASKKVIDFCKGNGILSSRMPNLKDIAEAKGKTIPRVLEKKNSCSINDS
ncbi:LOW QUALITY PROTEIN: hypothetical protein V2J09_000561, partial [Rumex salicifolius]